MISYLASYPYTATRHKSKIIAIPDRHERSQTDADTLFGMFLEELLYQNKRIYIVLKNRRKFPGGRYLGTGKLMV